MKKALGYEPGDPGLIPGVGSTMTKDERGYWRVTIWDKLGCPPRTYWFNYDDKDVVDILADEAYKRLAWKKPIIVLDMEYVPADPHDEEEDAWDWGWL